jgi:hypothetical protein
MPAWGFKAFVPKDKFVQPSPYITRFSPGHDARLVPQGTNGETVRIGFEFSQQMDCGDITNSLTITSNTLDDESPQLDTTSVSCKSIEDANVVTWPGALTSVFSYEVDLGNVFPGVHRVTLSNVTTADGNQSTGVSKLFAIQVEKVTILIKSGSRSTTFFSVSDRSTIRWSGHSWPTTVEHYCSMTRPLRLSPYQ